MKSVILNNLEENSGLSRQDRSEVSELVGRIIDYSPEEIYLTGSSVDSNNYEDIDLAVNFPEEEYSQELEDELLNLLEDSTCFGTNESWRGKKKTIVRGKINQISYDIFLWEAKSLPDDKKLTLTKE